MKKAVLALVALVVWAFCGTINYGAILAYDVHDTYSDTYRDCRSNQGFAAAWGGLLAPITTFITPFVTGFYVDGFKWSCFAEKSKEAK
jgi:hypothetical protein